METKTWAETDCRIEHEGKTFSANGSYKVGDRAAVYVNDTARHVTTWQGEVVGYVVALIVGEHRWTRWQSYRMAYVKVRLDGDDRVWWGRYNYDNGQLVRLRPFTKAGR